MWFLEPASQLAGVAAAGGEAPRGLLLPGLLDYSMARPDDVSPHNRSDFFMVMDFKSL